MTDEAITIIWLAGLRRALHSAGLDSSVVAMWDRSIDKKSAAVLAAMQAKGNRGKQ